MVGHLSARDSMKGTWRQFSFTTDPEGCVKQGSEMGVFFLRVPAFGEHRGGFFLRDFLFKGIFVKFVTEMQMPCKQVSLSIGGPLRENGGASFGGIFERKVKVYLGSSLGPRGH